MPFRHVHTPPCTLAFPLWFLLPPLCTYLLVALPLRCSRPPSRRGMRSMVRITVILVLCVAVAIVITPLADAFALHGYGSVCSVRCVFVALEFLAQTTVFFIESVKQTPDIVAAAHSNAVHVIVGQLDRRSPSNPLTNRWRRCTIIHSVCATWIRG